MKHLTLTERFNDTHCIKISRNKMLFFANTVGFDDIKNEAKEMFISIRNETKNIM